MNLAVKIIFTAKFIQESTLQATDKVIQKNQNTAKK